MRPLIQELSTVATPELLAEQLNGVPGLILLRTALFDDPQARYSFVAADPFLTFRSSGSRCEVECAAPSPRPSFAVGERGKKVQFGNPWHVLDALMARYELLDEVDFPFPLGGCFGFWGYDLKNFVEPRLTRLAVNDLELPDCCVGFYDSLVVFDHRLGKVWIVSTGLAADGSRSEQHALHRAEWWQTQLRDELNSLSPRQRAGVRAKSAPEGPNAVEESEAISSNFTRDEFLSCVHRAQAYIRAG